MELNPQAWLWMGDAVYTETPYSPQQQREALQHQMRVPEYIEFLKHVPVVEGVWDDHDIGPNVSQGSQFTTLPSVNLTEQNYKPYKHYLSAFCFTITRIVGEL